MQKDGWIYEKTGDRISMSRTYWYIAFWRVGKHKEQNITSINKLNTVKLL